MENYKNVDGNSNIVSYLIGAEFIEVNFTGGSTFVYSYLSAGKYHIDNMKELATAGKGLNTYIKKSVMSMYASRKHAE